MSNPSSPAGIIEPDQFTQYTEQWLTTASMPDDGELAETFLVDGKRLLLVRLPIEQMVLLLSTVGVQYIKVRFLLIPEEGESSLRFALALFATDAQQQRLSAYYLADDAATEAPSSAEQSGGIPTVLAKTWLAQWEEAPEITSAMFSTGAGVLEGYDFNTQDFLGPLFDKPSFENLELHLSFGLPKYYSAATNEPLTHTFGLMLRVYNSQQHTGSGYYDMATPNPPGI